MYEMERERLSKIVLEAGQEWYLMEREEEAVRVTRKALFLLSKTTEECRKSGKLISCYTLLYSRWRCAGKAPCDPPIMEKRRRRRVLIGSWWLPVTALLI